MATTSDANSAVRARGMWVIPVTAFVVGTVASLGIAVLLNATRTRLPAMAAVDEVSLVLPASGAARVPAPRIIASDWPEPGALPASLIRGNVIGIDGETAPAPEIPPAPAAANAEVNEWSSDPNVRWFNARPARPARTIWMTVTGYSPDERSCGDSADGLTATLHSVTTNAMKLVAADPTVLPYGSMVSVPGYDAESIVPVLDCGGAIKGDRLDLLFPTHEEALEWGRQRVLVTVWEYADGLPAENPRKVR